MKIEDLLKYQELELAISNIERKINDTEEFKIFIQCNAVVKQAKQNILDLDSEAERLISEVEANEAIIKETSEKISLAKTASSSTSQLPELESLEKNLHEANKHLQKASSDLSEINQRMYTVMVEAQKNVERFKEGNEKGAQVGAKLKEIRSSLAAESKPYKTELEKVKKLLPKYALELYANAKKHNKIHWVVERENGYCVGCGQHVELETAKKIEEQSIAECPRCFRVLYVK